MDIHRWTAVETASRIRSREVSVAEVTRAHLERMGAVNPTLNAVVAPVEEAMDVARELDERGPPDDAGPLWGVPVTTKINIDQKGYANSNGLPAYANAVADDDSPLVANLRRAGAVIVGRTNTPEFSLRWFTSNPLHGVTRNPWNPDITPGGSSGGAAAAVAGGIGCIGHGNDLGGSLRYPAYACGIASIRPSMGRIPALNPSQIAQGVERPPITQTLSVQGPIARTVADVRAGLAAMAGRDARDPLWTSAASSGRTRSGPLRIGVAPNPFATPSDPAVDAAMKRATDAARAIGEAVEIDPPHADECFDVWGRLLFTEVERMMLPGIEANGSDGIRGVVAAFRARFPSLDLDGFLRAMQRRIVLQREWSMMFDTIDLLVMPVSLAPPFPNDLDFREPERLPDIIAAQAPLCIVNLLGLPSVAIPTHVENGVPMGVQVVAPMHDDMFALDVAERLEGKLGTLWQQVPEPAH